jgi:hypothetical protein
MAETQLHQHLAAEPNIKAKELALGKETEHTLSKKAHHFVGNVRTYQPKEDTGEKFPDELEPLVTTVPEKLQYYLDSLSDLISHSVVKEETNATAIADLIYDKKVIKKDVHATALLTLENKLKGLRSKLMAIPTLDPKYMWNWNKDQNYYQTDPIQTLKSKKVPTVLVKYEATDKHPAQTELIHEDQTVGIWTTTKLSGAISSKMKSEILTRYDKWELAVKDARQRANNAKLVVDGKLGVVITDSILHGTLPI